MKKAVKNIFNSLFNSLKSNLNSYLDIDQEFGLKNAKDSLEAMFALLIVNLNAYRGKKYIIQKNEKGTDIQTDNSIKIYINRLSNNSIKIILLIFILLLFLFFLFVYNFTYKKFKY